MDLFGKITAVLLLVILLVCLPVRFINLRQREVTNTYVTKEVTEMVLDILRQGEVTTDSWERFVYRLSETERRFTINISIGKEKVNEREETYMDMEYTESFLETLYDKGTYSFNKGEYVTLTVTSEKTGKSNGYLDALLFGLSNANEKVVFGGVVE